MLAYKNLLLVVEGIITKNPELKTPELEKVVANCREFLVSTKTFEYEGTIKMQYAATIKLEGIKTDFDDVIKALVGKRNDIEFEAYLCLVMADKPIESMNAESKTEPQAA